MTTKKCSSCGDSTQDDWIFQGKPRCVECYAELKFGAIQQPAANTANVAVGRRNSTVTSDEPGIEPAEPVQDN